MIIQIYEIQTPEEAEALIALGVQHIGSVAFQAPPAYDASVLETIRRVRNLGAAASLIPLLTDADDICRMADHYQPDILHFCEDPSQEDGGFKRARKLAEKQKSIRQCFPGLQIMRSVPIGPRGQAHRAPTLAYAEIFEPVSDLFLTDTLLLPESSQPEREQPVDGFIGITGKTCDWDEAARLVECSILPVILAGGIGPENARQAVLHVRPAGVDSCTGTNAWDKNGKPIRFQKDREKVARLVHAVRCAELEIGAAPQAFSSS